LKDLKSKLAHVASISKDSKKSKHAKTAKHLPKASVNESSTQSFERYAFAKTCKCAWPLIARICLNDSLKREYKRPRQDRGRRELQYVPVGDYDRYVSTSQ